MAFEKAFDCILGGAVGDSFGAEIEFMQLSEIKEKFRPNGLTKLIPAYGKLGHITDDTQMTLFTLDGLGHDVYDEDQIVELVHFSYLKWLYTQGAGINNPIIGHTLFSNEQDLSILEYEDLYYRRAPGNTCLSSLKSISRLGIPPIFPKTYRVNNSFVERSPSNGCGGVMRSAPFGLKYSNPVRAFDLAVRCTKLTHDGSGAYIPAGIFAVIISLVYHRGMILSEAVYEAIKIGKTFPTDNSENEVYDFIESVLYHDEKLSKEEYHKDHISEFEQWNGQGWVGDEALVIALHSVLQTNSFKDAIIMAANHNGDSDSTAAIAGNIAGLRYGVPEDWSKPIELQPLMKKLIKKVIS